MFTACKEGGCGKADRSKMTRIEAAHEQAQLAHPKYNVNEGHTINISQQLQTSKQKKKNRPIQSTSFAPPFASGAEAAPSPIVSAPASPFGTSAEGSSFGGSGGFGLGSFKMTSAILARS